MLIVEDFIYIYHLQLSSGSQAWRDAFFTFMGDLDVVMPDIPSTSMNFFRKGRVAKT